MATRIETLPNVGEIRLDEGKEDEPNTPMGIVVVSGLSGVGKDSAIEVALDILDTEHSIKLDKVVTCTTRPPRTKTDGTMEKHGVDYYFVDEKAFDTMKEEGEFVEEPVRTGESWKGTPRAELLKGLGTVVVWRIDPTRALQVAQGNFYNGVFSAEDAAIIQKNTCVILVDANDMEVKERRADRDSLQTQTTDYESRDNQELESVRQLRDLAKTGNSGVLVVINQRGKLKDAAQELANAILKKFYSAKNSNLVAEAYN